MNQAGFRLANLLGTIVRGLETVELQVDGLAALQLMDYEGLHPP
jgi:predicted DNA-binding protein (UPF0251 family)